MSSPADPNSNPITAQAQSDVQSLEDLNGKRIELKKKLFGLLSLTVSQSRSILKKTLRSVPIQPKTGKNALLCKTTSCESLQNVDDAAELLSAARTALVQILGLRALQRRAAGRPVVTSALPIPNSPNKCGFFNRSRIGCFFCIGLVFPAVNVFTFRFPRSVFLCFQTVCHEKSFKNIEC